MADHAGPNRQTADRNPLTDVERASRELAEAASYLESSTRDLRAKQEALDVRQRSHEKLLGRYRLAAQQLRSALEGDGVSLHPAARQGSRTDLRKGDSVVVVERRHDGLQAIGTVEEVAKVTNLMVTDAVTVRWPNGRAEVCPRDELEVVARVEES